MTVLSAGSASSAVEMLPKHSDNKKMILTGADFVPINYDSNNIMNVNALFRGAKTDEPKPQKENNTDHQHLTSMAALSIRINQGCLLESSGGS